MTVEAELSSGAANRLGTSLLELMVMVVVVVVMTVASARPAAARSPVVAGRPATGPAAAGLAPAPALAPPPVLAAGAVLDARGGAADAVEDHIPELVRLAQEGCNDGAHDAVECVLRAVVVSWDLLDNESFPWYFGSLARGLKG